ncbi:hypothetical protein ACFQ4N_17810 [Oceanobacillus iheyensis]|uniref:Uncharacterized protein n=1 Tax=Oceanobacillus iheyensis (strain DSM 14371 / CIP 107618 / JCM 11309 / KCTC 3954 / HTE831) TaxID=221109 RepID=Q8EU70_OCEIH|nr:hypothetical protein [Oceanobacillus iheyensis]BAC11975.1 hypothetical protein [Oceanobacillus iheyensis HTE831]
MKKSNINLLIIGVIVAVIWGYFADLKNGELGWFIGRIIFIPSFVLLINNLHIFKNSDSNTNN